MFNKVSKEKIHALEQIIKNQEATIKELNGELEARHSVLFMLEEAVPKEQNERRKYVGDIALFYATIFKEKLKHFRGLQLEELSKYGRSEKVNDIFRANLNCFDLMGKWMDEKTKEHFGDLETMRNSFDTEEEFISNFRKTYEN